MNKSLLVINVDIFLYKNTNFFNTSLRNLEKLRDSIILNKDSIIF